MTQSKPAPHVSVEVDVSRYEIERKLGEGGAGEVFLARDRETGDRVALKKLFRMDGRSVMRLKREFRSLVDLAHPHIVKLYDMGRASDSWFLTMEYLAGEDLTTYLRPANPSTRTQTAANDNQRLASAFQQLARAIQALHQAGMLHRDLKPTNVMVVNDRVVMLDFGLVRELDEAAAKVTEEGSVAGTPAYMAPEQLRAGTLSPASDWYSFGVMLYEALAGELPFDGSVIEILRSKLEYDATELRELAPDVPAWLNDLCMALLRRDPAERPSGEDVLLAFERAHRPRTELPPTATDNLIQTENETRSLPLVGRREEVAALWRAFHEAEAGRAVVAHVRGLSGTGKSSLIEHFLDELEAEMRDEVLVLRSRCYELEQMPFKALDAVLDTLVRHLFELDDLEVAQVLPLDVAALTQLFPALERLRAVKQLIAGAKPPRDALHERQRAENALRQLLERLAIRQPIVVWVDDLQWGDLDSARILRTWMQEPASAPILFLFSYRSDEVETSTCLTSLLTREAVSGGRPAVEHTVDIAVLDGTDIRSLCTQRLGSLPGGSELVDRIVHEAQGSPFLASQLLAFAEAMLVRGDAVGLDNLSLDALVAQTGAMLPAEAATLLAILSVAGRPMVPKLALHAARIRQSGRAMVHALRGLNLVRTRDVGGTRMLEVYHDRVRERVQATLSEAERTAMHQALFDALAFSGQADADWLHTLALGAGKPAEALEYGKAAAERATVTLAFERAAELYRRCLELAPAEESGELWTRLADALVLCSRGLQAAEAYLEAAKRVPAARAARFKRLAASHLVRTGHFEQGHRLVRQVLADMDASVPESDGAVIAAIVWQRTRLKLRGLKYQLRAEPEASPELLARFDVFDALASALQQTDPLRSTLLQERSLLLALDLGEPRRLLRAFGSAAIRASISGSPDSPREADAWLHRAAAVAQHCPESAAGFVSAVRAISAFMLGRIKAIIEPSLEADRILRSAAHDELNSDYYLRFAVASVRLGARVQLGAVRETCVETHELLKEAVATDNRAVRLTLTLVQTGVEQIEARFSSSRPRLDQEAAELPEDRFGVLHSLHITAVLYAACASGDYDWVDERLSRLWDRWISSPISRSGYLAVAVHATHARLQLNRFFMAGRDPARLDQVRRDIKALRRQRGLGEAQVQRIEARLAYATGNTPRAIALFRGSVPSHEGKGFVLESERDRYALGALLGGPEGGAMMAQAVARLREAGLVDPLGDIRAFCPELVRD